MNTSSQTTVSVYDTSGEPLACGSPRSLLRVGEPRPQPAMRMETTIRTSRATVARSTIPRVLTQYPYPATAEPPPG